MAFLFPHLLQLMIISLQLSTTKGIQKQKIPVKQYKQTAQLTAAHPGLVLTRFDPINEHLLQGWLYWSTMKAYFAELYINITMPRINESWQLNNYLRARGWWGYIILNIPNGLKALGLVYNISLVWRISLIWGISLII